MATSDGSYALINSIPREDATVIAKLRAAGAIILGKTTMTQMAGMKCTTARTGWSARGGQPSSAYVLGGDPLGSSSGSAVAVSAGWAAASLGTDTLGSLTAPAGRAALYAIRPTVRRWDLSEGLGSSRCAR
jgi:amidase